MHRHVLTALLVGVLVFAPATRASAGLFGGDITLKDEIEMGREFDKQAQSMFPMVEDPMVVDYVTGIVNRLVAAKLPMPFAVKTRVVMYPMMNAFAVPGGYIYVFTGLIDRLDSEAQLASVIAHELAHVSQRHAIKRMEDMQAISIASLVGTLAGAFLGVAGGGHNSGQAASALIVGSQAASASAYLKYTMASEREADHLGINTLTAAGYNPEAMPQTFEIMHQQLKFKGVQRDIPSYLSTHPGLEERSVYLRDRISRMDPTLTGIANDNTTYDRIRALVRGRYSDAKLASKTYEAIPEAERTSYDWMGMGIALERQKANKQALAAFEKSLAMAPGDPLVLREAGIFFYLQGDQQRAAPLLQKAAVLDPRDAMALYFSARLMADKKEYASAISTMRRVADMVPEDAEVRQHLGRILGESGDPFGGHLQLAYAALFRGDMERAGYFRGKAEALAKTPEQKEQLEAYDEAAGEREGS